MADPENYQLLNINLGDYVEGLVDWIQNNLAGVLDGIAAAIDFVVSNLEGFTEPSLVGLRPEHRRLGHGGSGPGSEAERASEEQESFHGVGGQRKKSNVKDVTRRGLDTGRHAALRGGDRQGAEVDDSTSVQRVGTICGAS